ncbi:RNA-binding protein [Candidatus Woesearchaeota archaeon CG10_big_fil_rev_8_21_14_0_10_32_24]|nr:MAG: RNA-binding protein [Candidatus Woesearchaeota archaeon CG10_big_fil_rev_8_21_14_0_10_32_24]
MKQTGLKAKDINKELGLKLTKKDQCILKEDTHKILYINNEPSFFYYNGKPIPTLKYLQTHERLKKVMVDMGAVKFVVNGADIMRPGVMEIQEGIAKNDVVVVVDQNNGNPLAVGIALLGTEDLRAATSGKVIKNIHYVGDDLWKND